jgi:hypothetical protein
VGQAPRYAFLRVPSWFKNLDSRLRGNDKGSIGVHRRSSFGSARSPPRSAVLRAGSELVAGTASAAAFPLRQTGKTLLNHGEH